MDEPRRGRRRLGPLGPPPERRADDQPGPFLEQRWVAGITNECPRQADVVVGVQVDSEVDIHAHRSHPVLNDIVGIVECSDARSVSVVELVDHPGDDLDQRNLGGKNRLLDCTELRVSGGSATNLTARLDEARQKNWHGEIDCIEQSLTHLALKLEQLKRAVTSPVALLPARQPGSGDTVT